MKTITKKSIAFLSSALLCFSAAVFSSCKNEESESSPVIVSFEFEKSKNSAAKLPTTPLTRTVSGVIDAGNKTITVKLPEDLFENPAERALLTPTIITGKGASVVTSSMDFSSSPVKIAVTTNEGNSETYLVNVEKAVATVTRNKLLFTEYYSGAASPYKGNNNQFIEIYNISDYEIDLSGVELTKNAWTNGTRDYSRDQSVTLKGKLPGKGILVIYSQRCSYFTGKADSASVKYQSDRLYNSIITANGTDSFTLTSNGNLLDCLGPANGEGTGWTWGTVKHMQRKNTIERFQKWTESEWITEASTNSTDDFNTTAGVYTQNVPSAHENDITYFALENVETPVYGEIDNKNFTILVQLNDTLSPVQKITVSTNAQVVRYNNKDIISGITEVNFSKPFTIKVYKNNNTWQDYSVTAQIVHYNFNNAASGYYRQSTKLPEDNDVILIYYKTSDYYLGTAASGTGLAGVKANLSSTEVEYTSGAASLCVTLVDPEQNIYAFTNSGKYLTCGEYNAQKLNFAAAPGKYSLWKLRKVNGSENLFYFESVNAVSGSNVMALEYYSSKFTTYRQQNSAVYQFEIYTKKN